MINNFSQREISFLVYFFIFRLPIAQDCHEMWSKEHKKLARRGWSETEIQAHFKEREIIEYQRYNQMTGKRRFSSELEMQQKSM